MAQHRTTLWRPLSVRAACLNVAAQTYMSGRVFRVDFDDRRLDGSHRVFCTVPDGCRVVRFASGRWPAGRAYIAGSIVMIALSVAFFIGFALLAKDAGSWAVTPAIVFVTLPIAIAVFESYRFSQQSVRINAMFDGAGRVRSGVFTVLGKRFCVGDQALLARGGSAWKTHSAQFIWFVGDDPMTLRPMLTCDGHYMPLAKSGVDLRLSEHGAWAELATFTSNAPRRSEPTDD